MAIGKAGQGNIVTGFIEGLVKTTGTSVIVLPFADKISGATFRYASENLMVETFSQQGIKGASGSCPFREECSMELNSENLAWSFIQAATNTLAVDSDRLLDQSFSVELSEVTAGTPPVSTFTLSGVEVSALGDLYAADENGEQINVTATVATGDTTFEFEEDLTGDKVTIYYQVNAGGTNNLLKLGSGSKLGEIGVFGRFFGCPENYQVTIPRGIIQSNLELGVGDGPGQAALTVMALRNNAGDYAYLQRF